MLVDIAICTYDDRIFELAKIVSARNVHNQLRYIISHQVSTTGEKEKYLHIYKQLNSRADTTVLGWYGRGLSKNRNMVISMCSADLVVISDDDIKYRDNIYEIICSEFESTSVPIAACCFRLDTPNGNLFKKYKVKKISINRFDSLSISSAEVVLNRKVFKDLGITFDECFGLGTKYPCCEEVIYLIDAINLGAQILRSDQVIGTHEPNSSGQRIFENEQSTIARGAFFSRAFGPIGTLLIALFFLKNIKASQIKNVYSIVRRLANGYRSYKRENRKDS